MTDAREPINESFLVGGPERRDIVIVDYDPRWPELFTREEAKIRSALDEAALRIEHVGSTAVPGLAAKPIVDVLVTVRDVEDDSGYVPALEGAGYVVRVREPGHRMLRTPELDVHLHVLVDGDPNVGAQLGFRDRLRASSGDRDLYAATKRRLAERDWLTMNHYAQAKSEVIQRILARGGP